MSEPPPLLSLPGVIAVFNSSMWAEAGEVGQEERDVEEKILL